MNTSCRILCQGVKTGLSLSKVRIATRMMSSTLSDKYNFKTMAVTIPKEFIFHVELNRPKKMNAINADMWREVGECFNALAEDPDCRSIVLSGSGKLFCAGLDMSDAMNMFAIGDGDIDIARKCKQIYKAIRMYQDSFSALEMCPKPVIAAVHSAVIGAGVDMICGADIRYCSQDAWFQIKEIELGMSADVGTMQRFPKVIGSSSLVRELVFTGRKFLADEAIKAGFVNRVFDDKESLLKGAFELAEMIAKKSPVGIQGSKVNLNYSRDHPVDDGLKHHALWNMTMLQSEDVMKAVMGMIDKSSEPPAFSKL